MATTANRIEAGVYFDFMAQLFKAARRVKTYSTLNASLPTCIDDTLHVIFRWLFRASNAVKHKTSISDRDG